MSDVDLSLLNTAGRAVVQAMTSEAWTTVRLRLIRLLGLGDSHREHYFAAQLDDSRADAVSRRLERRLLEGRWQGRLKAFVQDRPEVARELARLVAELRPQATDEAKAKRRGTVALAGALGVMLLLGLAFVVWEWQHHGMR